MNIHEMSLSTLVKAIKTKKLSAQEVASHYMGRIEKLDSQLNSFVLMNPNVITEAKSIDDKIARGEDAGTLAGVPLGVKDIFCTKGLRTTACSKILGNFVPPYDATVVSRLKKAGTVTLGKLNMDEFAMGSSNEVSHFGAVKNPWDTTKVPGGSSGGSAAAQAARLCAGSLGTDTGGSIRQPASFCGVVGIKPTYGRISRYGIVSYASSLDQAGPITSTVEDAALMLEAMCGHDEKDQTTAQIAVPQFANKLSPNMKGVRVGILKEFMQEAAMHPDTLATVRRAIDVLKSEGAEITEVSVPLTSAAVPVYYLVASSEASSNLSRYDGVRYGYRAHFENLAGVPLDEFYMKTRAEGFGPEVKRRIMLGTFCLSSGYYDAYYNKACQVRRLMKDQFSAALQKCDVIISPVSTHPAFELGGRVADPLAMYLNDIYTVSTNLAGLPGMSVPFGISKEGLPIGVQLQAGHFEEQKLLNVGLALEKAANLTGKVPRVY